MINQKILNFNHLKKVSFFQPELPFLRNTLQTL